MSAESHPAHADHHHDGHGAASHGSLRDYVTGFVLAVILTVIPFWLVMGHVISDTRLTAWIIMLFAVAQVIVHLVYFLHMNSRAEGGWTMLAMIFTIALVFITFLGSVWVMDHLNENMMPMAAHSTMLPPQDTKTTGVPLGSRNGMDGMDMPHKP